ncbi:hypothetical protein HOP50_15g75650 [Chloropicon primus]|nr:hypothetical protein HOP50_15g75650 [Chloropicon primus]
MVWVKHHPKKKGRATKKRAPEWSEGEKEIALSHGRSGDPTLVDEERHQRWEENGVGKGQAYLPRFDQEEYRDRVKAFQRKFRNTLRRTQPL